MLGKTPQNLISRFENFAMVCKILRKILHNPFANLFTLELAMFCDFSPRLLVKDSSEKKMKP